MKPKSSGLPNDDEDDVVSFGSDEATMIRPRSVLDDAFDARTVVQIGNKNQFGQTLDPAVGKRLGEETPVPAAPKATAAPAAERSPSVNPLPEPPPDLEAKRMVPPAPRPSLADAVSSPSIANAVTGKKLRKDLSAGTNTNFPIPKPEHPSSEPQKVEAKIEAKFIPTPDVRPELKAEPKPEPKLEPKVEAKVEPKVETKKVPPAPAPAPAPVAPSAPTPVVSAAAVDTPKEAPKAKAPQAPAPAPAAVSMPSKREEHSEDHVREAKTAHHDSTDASADGFSSSSSDMNFEPQKRALPKKYIAAAVAVLAVIAYFVFGTSETKPGGSQELASAEQAPVKKKDAKAAQRPMAAVPKQPAAEENQVNQPSLPVASVGGTQAVLQQFGESFSKTQNRTRPDAQAD